MNRREELRRALLDVRDAYQAMDGPTSARFHAAALDVARLIDGEDSNLTMLLGPESREWSRP